MWSCRRRGGSAREGTPGAATMVNGVAHAALGGGVTRSLAFAAHGKSLSRLMLAIELPPV